MCMIQRQLLVTHRTTLATLMSYHIKYSILQGLLLTAPQRGPDFEKISTSPAWPLQRCDLKWFELNSQKCSTQNSQVFFREDGAGDRTRKKFSPSTVG